ncbi:MAG: 3-oxoacyl-ACP reductase FabG [Acidimicrobiaceae bacterium]|nr:3-oxoacyl-ACP reductase FabG [Acidimicrobiaceae bacterium]
MDQSSPRHVIITGGATGIGLATVRRFLASGDKVTLCYRTHEPPTDLAPKENLLEVKVDVTSQQDIERAFKQGEERFGPVGVLVVNAGATVDTLMLRMSEDAWNKTIETNLTASYRLTKRALASMVKNRYGRIVLISSVVAVMGSAGQANYAASKAGMIGLGRSLAREVASRNITVNIVAPGAVATDMVLGLPQARLDTLSKETPMGRIAHPEEIASAIYYLGSDEASFVTGAVLAVDGGLSMGI